MEKWLKENWLKRKFTIVKVHFILLVGVGLFTYNLFDFRNDYYCKGEWATGILPELFPSFGSYECNHSASYYYYTDTGLALLAVGAILIAIGFLKFRKRNSE